MTPSRSSTARSAQRWLRAVPILLLGACGGPQKLGDVGATCFRDDDCKAGLICVAPMEGDINRVCSNDPTPLISNVEGPPIMAMGAAGGAAGMAGSMTAGGNAGSAMAGSGGAKAGNGGTDSGGTDTAGTDTGGTDTGGSGGTAGTDTAGTAGTAPEGGAPP